MHDKADPMSPTWLVVPVVNASPGPIDLLEYVFGRLFRIRAQRYIRIVNAERVAERPGVEKKHNAGNKKIRLYEESAK